MAAVIARIGMFATAVVAIVVAAIWLSDAHRFQGAQAEAAKAKTQAQLLSAADRFLGGSALTPGTDAEAARAFVFLRAGQRPRAEALLEDVLRTEPRNVRAWAGLYFADRGRKPARAAYAQARIRALSPAVKRP